MSGSTKSLVTIALFSYNQEAFVRAAVEAALAQTYQPLEIIISDDASTDGTWQVIQETVRSYSGPHTVVARRNEINAGIGEHVNQIFELSKGALIVAAAGDDVSYPQRVASLVAEWIRCGCPEGALHSNSRLIDGKGSWIGKYKKGLASDAANACLEFFVERGFPALMQGATAAYTRAVFERFGRLDGTVEDGPLTFRALLIGKLMYVDEVLIDYRTNVGNASSPLRRTDRARIARWIEGAVSVLGMYRRDYQNYCKQAGIQHSARIVQLIDELEKRYVSSRGLASPSLLANLRGLVALPVQNGFGGRLRLAARYFGLKN